MGPEPVRKGVADEAASSGTHSETCVRGAKLHCLNSSDKLETFFSADTAAEVGTEQQHLIR